MKINPTVKRRTLSIRIAALLFGSGLLATSTAQAQLFYKSTTAANAWTGSFWGTGAGGPYTNPWVSGSAVVFEDNLGTALALTGATTNFSSITANESINVTAGGTIGTGGSVATITVATGKNLNFGSQTFSTAAGTGFIKNGDGILTLAGGTYAGGFTINAGTVAVGGVNAMGAGGALTINGGTIRSSAVAVARDLSGKYAGGIAIGGDFTLGDATNNGLLTFTNNMALGAATRTITANSAAVFGGIISGSPGVGLIKNGTGSLALSGANTYTGGSTVNSGALSFRTTAAVAPTGNHAFGANATLGLGLGAGGFLMTDLNNALGGTAPMVGTITLDPATKIGVDTGAGAFDFNTALAASTRGLVKLGNNALTLSVDNSLFTGNIFVNEGSLLVANNNALGSSMTGNTTINGGNGSGGVSLTLGTAADLTIAESINFAGNVGGRSRMAHSSAFNHTLSGPINVTSDTNIVEWNSAGSGSITVSGDITGTMTNNAGLLLRGTSTSATNQVTGSITLTGGALSKTDAGTWLVGAPGKTYTGIGLGVSNGILKMGVADYLQGAPVLTLGNSTGGSNGTLDLNGFNQTVGGIIYSGQGVATGTKTITSVAPAVLTVDNDTDFVNLGTSASINNVVLTGAVGLTKAGSGKLQFTGTNTNTGAYIINEGTLDVTGTLINNSSLHILMAAPDDTFLSGPANPVLTRAVAAGLNKFGGFGSKVTAASIDLVVVPPTALQTTADILLSNTNAAADVLSMQWRLRTVAEAAGSNPNAVLSDVVSITGMDNGADIFVLQMNYNDAALTTLSLNEGAIAASGELRLGWNDAGTWKTATAGNTVVGSTFVGVTDWNTYYTGISAVDDGSDLNLFLGSYGVNPANNTVWAVLDHNSEFAVIPEPSTLVLGGLALLGFVGVGLRRGRMAK